MDMAGSYEIPDLPVDGREGLVLFFIAGGHKFGIRLTDVVHIEPFNEGAFEVEFRGNVIIRGKSLSKAGENVTVIDLSRFLEIESSVARGEQTLILLRGEDGIFGLLVDEVQAIIPANHAPELAYPALLGGEGRIMYDGFFNRDNKLILALSPSNIRDSLSDSESAH